MHSHYSALHRPFPFGFTALSTLSYHSTPANRNRIQVGGQAVLGRQDASPTPWLTERHGYDPTCLHSHYSALHRPFPFGFTALSTLSYHSKSPKTSRIHSFGM